MTRCTRNCGAIVITEQSLLVINKNVFILQLMLSAPVQAISFYCSNMSLIKSEADLTVV